ncbi:MAG: hypothetical protein HY294_13530 [Candidatus Rokubacteria bacterium]|nr:hypothetical protein [Candidatus Rokubacteria bacterium]MBI3827012.1 hypothetical protein [Candidatus Rokubacteria bacterium]
MNVTGKWTGTWTGFGIQDIPRSALATAQFTQTGRNGYGRLVLDDTAAAEALPLTIRWAGLAGVPVLLEVSGSKLTVRHELGDEVAAFTVSGDQMVGRISNVDVPIRIKLTREP